MIDAQDHVFVNPARMRLSLGLTLIVVGTSKKAVLRALRAPYEPLSDQERARLVVSGWRAMRAAAQRPARVVSE